MTDLMLANAVVAFAAFVQTASAIGFAMISVPLLALIDLGYVPGPLLFAMLGLSLIMTFQGWRDVDRQGLAVLLPGLGIGTILGALSLSMLPTSATGALFGGMVLVALAVGQIGLVPRLSPPIFALLGIVAGLMGTTAGIHGPALAILYQEAAARTARATIALIFVIASCLSLATLYLNELFDQTGLLMGMALLPGVLTGYVLAISARHRISDVLARRIMLGLAASSALVLIAKSLG